jgi:type 2 lantibiotic biosynthesis protein LanM
MPALSQARRQDIGRRAETLWERLAAPSAERLSDDGADPAALAPWIQAYSAGDSEAFARRLAWDGLDPRTVLRALFEPLDPGREPPAWTSALDGILIEATALAEELDDAWSYPESRLFPPSEPPAFLELAVPLLRWARRALAEKALGEFAPTARASFERQLLRELSFFSELALYEKFSGRRSLLPPSETDVSRGYRSFVLELLQSGLTSFYAEFPVLARQLVRLCDCWTKALSELLDRLRSDRARLAEVFAPGSEPGRVEEVEAGIADRHDGGRRVVALRFTSGLRLVYKPRDLRIEWAYNALLGWLKEGGLACAPRALTVLPRDGYGWVEHASEGSFPDREAVRRYYRQSGALICIAFVLRGRDLHLENVVASSDGPILVDTEMLMQPVLSQGSEWSGGGGDESLEESCLGSGLLTLLETDGQGVLCDIGGLRGRGGGEPPVAGRRWKRLGTDFIHFEREARFTPRLRNRVVREGVAQRPDDFAEDVLSGFVECYRFLWENRERILAPDGPLSRFALARLRLLLRSSTRYGALQHVLAAPRYQRSGVRRSFALDALNRPFSTAEERPPLWPLVAEERRALEGLDIPRFTVGASEAALQSETGEILPGSISRAGLDGVADRLRAFSETHLERERDILREALSSSVDSRFRVEPPASSPEASPFIDYALWIGGELIERARPREDGRLFWSRWLPPATTAPPPLWEPDTLYHGTAGPALFFAALSVVTGDRRWKGAARATFPSGATAAPERRGSEVRRPADIGLGSGIGSLVYAASLMGWFLDDGGLLDFALRWAREIDEEAIQADRSLDLTAGSAGAILALLTLHRLRPEPWLVDRARRCAEHLLAERIEPTPGRVAWRAANGELLAGFAHGAAGIAYALLRLFQVTDERIWLEAAAGGYLYERSVFSARHGNWPIVKGGRTSPERGAGLMTAWCHGASGIGLGRALALEMLRDDSVLEEIDIAMKTTGAYVLQSADHLCCGNLGRAEALLTGGVVLSQDRLLASAEELARRVTTRAHRRGHFGLPGTAFDYRIFVPGFFRGLAGVGYQLLRFAAPRRIPSVLGFQPPPDPARRPGGNQNARRPD